MSLLKDKKSIKESVILFISSSDSYEPKERKEKANSLRVELLHDNRLSIDTKQKLAMDLKKIYKSCK